MAAVTRLGLYGGSRAPYGSFAGKTEQALEYASIEFDKAYGVYIKNRNGTWEHTQIVFTGTDFGTV